MEIPKGWVRSDFLVESLKRDHISIFQIEAWRKKGLLQSPFRHYLGRAKGTESYYPPETVDQIRLILKLKREEHIRSLMDIQTWLWLNGFPVETSRIKQNLISIAEELKRFQVNDPQEIPNRIEELLKEQKLLKKYALFTQKATEETKGVLMVLITLMSGLPLDFDSESNTSDYAIATRLEKMMDIESAREDGYPAIKEKGLPKAGPWLVGVPGDYISDLSKRRLLSISEIQKASINISEEDLENVRADLKLLINSVSSLGIFQELFLKRYGLSGINKMVEQGRKNITVILLLLAQIKYQNLDLRTLLLDFQKISGEFQVIRSLDKLQKKRVTKELRRKVDRN